MEISFSSYLSEDEKYITSIIRDITERKQAEVKIKDQLERLTALRTIDMAISSSLDLRVTLNILLDQITGSLHVDASDILLLNHNTMRLEFNAGRGFRTDALKHTRLRVGEGFAGKSAIEGRVICITNLKSDNGGFSSSPLFHKEDFVSYCCVPMIAKGNVKGVLEIFHRSHVVHDPERLAFVEALALQAAIAIDNSKMFNEVYHSNMELMLAYETTIEGWSHALDLRDKETEGHSHRVTDTTLRIARAIGIKEDDLVHIRRGALLHDIGKMGIPDSILFKPGPLTEDEWKIMEKHPVYAYEMLQPIQYLRSALDIPYCHHEKWDGTGYPRGLRGEAIPIAARIFSVVDVWDALHSDRPYRPAWPLEKIKDHIFDLAGKDFDPVMVDVFLKMEW
ncbi:MAG: HD domain-containing protein [Deltaproteobacteria bacterium]|nr:HD domain-containing protein [Deltaproteobacteria bacterium]